MKQTILIAVLFFFVGSVTTYTYINYLSNSKNILNGVSSSIEGSEWISENQKAKLKFSENDNSCYLEIITDEKSFIFSFSYSKVNEDYILTVKEEGMNVFAMMFIFQSIESINLKSEGEFLVLPIKDNQQIKFNRVN